MNSDIVKNIFNGVEKAFINYEGSSNLAYKPQFISNDEKSGRKVLTIIENELRNCSEFKISVAFITESGIVPLLMILRELEKKNIPGQILTTDYLEFSEPKALLKLNELKNIELRMYCTNEEKHSGFHTKGYMFKNDESYSLIIGSSNMTLKALTVNKEWNTKLVSTSQGEFAIDMLDEFERLWESSIEIADVIDTYREIYNSKKETLRLTKIPTIKQYKLEPNTMQVEFIKNLKEIRKNGQDKALLISATGTGKTYASAFALREEKPKKALFLVHREQIAKQAIKSYRDVFGNTVSLGLLSGTHKDYDAEYLFSTMQMMAKEEVRERFASDEFQIIVVDEVHRAGADSYQKIMKYFNPSLWLGMTASPERPDGFDIYKLFNHNIAYEIRLQKALESGLLCPFQYFGITDISINGETFDDESSVKDFNLLVADERVEYIIEQATYYGYSGNRVKGLVFCSTKKEAKFLSDKFNEREYEGRTYRTLSLSGDDSQDKREEAIELLANDYNEDGEFLDYIFTVDIFNEGVDIPEINQIIMLRPTQSPIVFVQQLGRGLRKADGKEFVVVLDFIGNYTNNFMIPIALFGERTYNKDNMRRCVIEGNRIMPGSASIHFDEIAKDKILKSIDNVTTKLKLLSEKYIQLKNKLGKIPTLMEFQEYGEVDPLLFIEYSGTYHAFLQKVDKEYKVVLEDDENITLEFISKLIGNGKRLEELIILKHLLHHKEFEIEEIADILKNKYNREASPESLESAIRMISGKFLNSPSDKRKYAKVNIITDHKKEGYRRAYNYYKRLLHNDFFKHVKDILNFAISRHKATYENSIDESGLALYEKYSRKDVCRILNWEKDESSTIYGYRIKHETCPIFVTYHKQEFISESTKYEDEFINNKEFSWMTRSTGNWREEAQRIMDYRKNGLKVYLFIKKSDGEGSDFYYLGKCIPTKAKETSNTNGAPIMNIKLELEHSVRDDLYDYLSK